MTNAVMANNKAGSRTPLTLKRFEKKVVDQLDAVSARITVTDTDQRIRVMNDAIRAEIVRTTRVHLSKTGFTGTTDSFIECDNRKFHISVGRHWQWNRTDLLSWIVFTDSDNILDWVHGHIEIASVLDASGRGI